MKYRRPFWVLCELAGIGLYLPTLYALAGIGLGIPASFFIIVAALKLMRGPYSPVLTEQYG